MHLLHRIAQFDHKPTQDVPLPRIILGIDSSLHLLVINHTHTPNDFWVSEVSKVDLAFLISVSSCCQWARESPSRLNTHSASRSHRDWNWSHFPTWSFKCCTFASIRENGFSNAALSGNLVSYRGMLALKFDSQVETMGRRTSDV